MVAQDRWRVRIRAGLGRFIRYWYTYRTLVAVLIGLLVSGSTYWLYTQQVACDNQTTSDCHIRLSLHPEDRLSFESSNPNLVIIGIDDQTIKDLGGRFPLDRSRYATALTRLNDAKAGVVAFDIGFSDQGRTIPGDQKFADALAATKVPVVLAYGSSGEPKLGDGQIAMNSPVDQIPPREFRCSDKAASDTAPCTAPYQNVIDRKSVV